jgi:hypothetical protein
MPTISARLALGFGAAALSHAIFQSALGAVLNAGHLVPELVGSVKPVPPLCAPSTVKSMFRERDLGHDLYALLEPRLTGRLCRLSSGLVLSLASLLTFWFIVLPLKWAGVGGFQGAEVGADVAFDLTLGISTAILFWTGRRNTIGALPRQSSALARSS